MNHLPQSPQKEGHYLPSVSTTPVAILPPVSTTLVANFATGIAGVVSFSLNSYDICPIL
jgi:hypothetical protein